MFYFLNLGLYRLSTSCGTATRISLVLGNCTTYNSKLLLQPQSVCGQFSSVFPIHFPSPVGLLSIFQMFSFLLLLITFLTIFSSYQFLDSPCPPLLWILPCPLFLPILFQASVSSCPCSRISFENYWNEENRIGGRFEICNLQFAIRESNSILRKIYAIQCMYSMHNFDKNNFPGTYHHYNTKKIHFVLSFYLKIIGLGVRKTVSVAGLQSAIRESNSILKRSPLCEKDLCNARYAHCTGVKEDIDMDNLTMSDLILINVVNLTMSNLFIIPDIYLLN